MQIENIPPSLRQLPNWLCWRMVMRAGKGSKIPFVAKTGKAASSVDAADWCTFEEAMKHGHKYDGIGFVFTRAANTFGIDLDNCISESGELHPEAKRIVDLYANTFAEITPRGKGVHIIGFGEKPASSGCKVQNVFGCSQIEIYDQERYFTFTGNKFSNSSEVENCQDALTSLCGELWPVQPPTTRSFPPSVRSSPAKSANAKHRYLKYLEKLPMAISGQGGHANTFRAACDGFRFDLSIEDVWDGLVWFNANKTPEGDRWSDRELRHKLMQAQREVNEKEEVGKLLNAPRAAPERAPARSVSGPPTERPTQSTVKTPLAVGDGGEYIILGDRDPKDDRIVLSPRKTMPTAVSFVKQYHTTQELKSLVHYAGEFLTWKDNKYSTEEDAAIKSKLQPWLHNAKQYIKNKSTGELELVQFESNSSTIGSAVESIKSYAHLGMNTVAPSWIIDQNGDYDPQEILTCRTCSIHIPTRTVIPATPRLFTTSALDFDYDAAAAPPNRWLTFLKEIWGEDIDSIRTLQDWFGYMLTQDTRQQKIMLMVGPKRSGKGTIERVLTALVGKGNSISMGAQAFSGEFALEPLIGKSLFIMPDARFGGENISTVVERLLCISGEDYFTINRKNTKFSATLKLTTRVLCQSNELPKLSDSSGALASRFIILRMKRSFYGKEDLGLDAKLKAELPGILLWAIEGWERIRTRTEEGFNGFIQPSTSKSAMMEMEDLASPVGAFVRDCCIVGEGRRAFMDDIYAAWLNWCNAEGRTVKTVKQTFGRDLSSVVPSIERRRSTGSQSFYDGIELRK